MESASDQQAGLSESRRDSRVCSPARECREGKIKKNGVSPAGTAQIRLQLCKSEKDDMRQNRLR